ncbi:MAG TPA: hypothetical protein VL727_28370 [Puia sp.]|nr:hypothetical protein [Puia sp.]HXO76860.1 hypothetical protein [Puia sp.]
MAGLIESYKTGFITQRLNLTTEEAQKFWPIYNSYSAEVRQVNITYRQNHNELQMEESRLNIKKKYSVEFLKAISPGKINDFFKAEKDFDVIIRREMQRRQMQRRPFGGDQ